jgi:hypothetical protein
MGASAGGTNVTGVQQIEKGLLTAVSTAVNDFTTGSTRTLTVATVPANKKWILKNFYAVDASLVATIGFINAGEYINSIQIKHLSDSSTVAGVVYNYDQQIILNAGDNFRCKYSFSAYTSGTFNIVLSYVEIDV